MRAGSATPVLPKAELLANLTRARHERLQLREREMAWEPREPAVRIDPQLLGRHALEHAADPPGDQLWALDVEVLEIEHAGPQLLGAVELAPQTALGHFAVGELEHELVGRGVRDRRKQRPIGPLAVAEPPERSETDVPEAPLHRDALEAPVVELDQPLGLHQESLIT